MAFQHHGEIEISAEYPLLICRARGPWNRELVEKWREQALPVAEQLRSRGPWIGVGVMRGSMACTLDALNLHRETAEFMVDQLGGIASAHVASPDVDGYDMMRSVYERLFDGVCPHAHFHRLEEVRPWAEEQLRRFAQSSSGR